MIRRRAGRIRQAFALLAITLVLCVAPLIAYACTNPAGTAGEVIYNTSHQVLQYCNGTDWVAAGPIDQGSVGGVCANPAGEDGELFYNSDNSVPQYCNGLDWVSMGPTLNITAGLAGHWKFDDGSGSTAVDSAGSSDGILTNMDPSTDWVTGQIGGALDFDGVNDTVAIPSTYNWAAGDFSVAFWINIDTYSDYKRIVYMDDQFLIAYGDSGNRLSWNVEPDDVDGKITTADILGTNVWKHVVFVYDKASTSGQIYVDGQSQSMDNNDPALMNWDNTTKTDNTIFLMARDDVSEQDGIMDDFRMYNRALSGSEITNLYNWGLSVSGCSNPSGDPGDMFYNTSYNALQYCNGTDWVEVRQ